MVVFRFAVAVAALSSTAAILLVSERISCNAAWTCADDRLDWSEIGAFPLARSQARRYPA